MQQRSSNAVLAGFQICQDPCNLSTAYLWDADEDIVLTKTKLLWQARSETAKGQRKVADPEQEQPRQHLTRGAEEPTCAALAMLKALTTTMLWNVSNDICTVRASVSIPVLRSPVLRGAYDLGRAADFFSPIFVVG